MSTTANANTSPPAFLTEIYNLESDSTRSISYYSGGHPEDLSTPVSPDPTRPYVTLTFAQSLDAKIAGTGGKQLALSGKESLVMTHWMRTMHDAILVGIGTALNDDPQLNTRHLPALSHRPLSKYHCPRPIVLDSDLRLPTNCKLLKNYRAGSGRRPWVICSASSQSSDELHSQRKEALRSAGAHVIEVTGDGGFLSIPELLISLRERGIRSLMVEGGAKVIQSFLAAAKHTPSSTSDDAVGGVVDTIIITVAPTFVGRDGTGYGSNLVSTELPVLRHLTTQMFGHDVVVALQVQQPHIK